MGEWSAARILQELCDEQTRLQIASYIWKGRDAADATRKLARWMNFRSISVQKTSNKSRSEWLLRHFDPLEAEPILMNALLDFHLDQRETLMIDALDRLGVLHENGRITPANYVLPKPEEFRAALREMPHPAAQVELYLATAGLVMGGAWKDAGWRVLDELRRERSSAEEPAPDAFPQGTAPSQTDSSPVDTRHSSLTTLDILLIKATVATLAETEGAFDLEELKEVISEVIHLNTDRQRTYFHRGFLSRLLGETPDYDSVEMNEHSAAWTFAG